MPPKNSPWKYTPWENSPLGVRVMVRVYGVRVSKPSSPNPSNPSNADPINPCNPNPINPCNPNPSKPNPNPKTQEDFS